MSAGAWSFARRGRAIVYGGASAGLGTLFLFIAMPDVGRDGGMPGSAATMVEIGVGLLCIGVALFLFAWRRAQRAIALLDSGFSADAVITAMHYVSSTSDGEQFRQVEYRYQSSGGNPHIGKSGWLTMEETRNWNVGLHCTIKFDPANPEQSVWVGLRPGGEPPPARRPALSDAGVKAARTRAANPFRLARQSMYMRSAASIAIYVVITGVFALLALSFDAASGPSLGRMIYAALPLLLLIAFLHRFIAGVAEVRTWQRILRDGAAVEATVSRVHNVRFGRRISTSGWVISYTYRDSSRNDREGRSAYLSKRDAEAWNPGDKGIALIDRADAGRSIWIGGSGAAVEDPIAESRK